MKLPKKLWLPCPIALTGPMALETSNQKTQLDYLPAGLRPCSIARRRNVSLSILRTAGVSWLRCRQGYSEIKPF